MQAAASSTTTAPTAGCATTVEARADGADARRPRPGRARAPRGGGPRRARGGPVVARLRARQVARTTGQFLFALVAPQTDCEVLEIGGSRGYSTIWLAAGVRHLGGRVLSLEHDPRKCEAWRPNIAEAGLEDWAELIEGDAFETLPAIDDVFDVVFLDAEKERLRAAVPARARRRSSPGRSWSPTTSSRTRTRSAPTRAPGRTTRRSSRVTVPLDRGLEVSVASCRDCAIVRATAERRWSGLRRFPVRAAEVLARRGVSPGPRGIA